MPTTHNSYVPTEDDEQATLVAWLQVHGIPHFRVPSETYTTSWAQKYKNKRLGVVPGIPDIFVVIEGHGLIALEMKRQKGGKVSPDQALWIDRLNKASVPAHVCKGADEAIEPVRQYVAQSQR